MDIGTAQPSRGGKTDASANHLIDVLDPWEAGNVAWWLEQARAGGGVGGGGGGGGGGGKKNKHKKKKKIKQNKKKIKIVKK